MSDSENLSVFDRALIGLIKDTPYAFLRRLAKYICEISELITDYDAVMTAWYNKLKVHAVFDQDFGVLPVLEAKKNETEALVIKLSTRIYEADFLPASLRNILANRRFLTVYDICEKQAGPLDVRRILGNLVADETEKALATVGLSFNMKFSEGVRARLLK